MVNREALRQFLVEVNQAGYACGKKTELIKEADGSTTILYESEPWRSDDNFFGGESYGGRLAILCEKQAVWIMVYYGWAEPGEDIAEAVYEVLRGALSKMPKDYPFRGPQKYYLGEYTYTNIWSGELEQFSGSEKIIHGDKMIYKADYLGGLVDQRQDT